MIVQCGKCGHSVPQGQFRCGRCGTAIESRDSYDDLPEAGDPEPPPIQRNGALEAAGNAMQETEPGARDGQLEASDTARDSLIPRGTFASEEPSSSPGAAGTLAATTVAGAPLGSSGTARAQPAPTSSPGAKTPKPRASWRPKLALASAEPAKLPTPSESAAQRGATATESGSHKRVSTAKRPPFLASTILHEDMMPREPGKNVLTSTLWCAAALGLVVGFLGKATTAGALIAVGALSVLGMGFLSLSYVARAASTLAVTGVAFGLIVLWESSIEGDGYGTLLAASVSLSMGALWLRAWHRASGLSRALVAVGSLGELSWLYLSGSPEFLQLDASWQSWLPALLWLILPILALLGLLAFMDKHTTGACDVWAVCLALWYLADAIVRNATASGDGFDTLATLRLGEPVFASPLAVAFAQLLAAMSIKQRRPP